MTILNVCSKDGINESYYLKRGLSADELIKVKRKLKAEKRRAHAAGCPANIQHVLEDVLGFLPSRVTEDPVNA